MNSFTTKKCLIQCTLIDFVPEIHLFLENITKYEQPKMKTNAWQKYIFSFLGVSILLRLYSQDHLVSFRQTALARNVGNLVHLR